MEIRRNKLTPSKLLTYIKCARRMVWDTQRRENDTIQKSSIVKLLNENRVFNKRICEKALQLEGHDVVPSQVFSSENLSAKLDFSEITPEVVRLYHVTLSPYGGVESYYTLSGDPNYEHKPLFIRAAFCHKLVSELYPDRKIESHILAYKADETMPICGLSFYKLDTGIWSIDGVVPDECEKYVVDLDISETCKRYIRSEINVMYKTSLQTAIDLAYGLLQGDTPKCQITHACGSCKYREECLNEAFPGRDVNAHNLFEINSFNYLEKNKLLKAGKYLMQDVPEEKLNARQARQVEATLSGDGRPRIDINILRDGFTKLQYPLHCIDFETAVMPGGVFNGVAPSQGVAYQFSDHILDENLNIIGHKEYINLNSGENPTIEFVRALKQALSSDMGTPVIYSQHENTYLCFAYEQILKGQPEDAKELLDFIKSITTPTKELVSSTGGETWEPIRKALDLLDLVRNGFYQGVMKSSYSIKSVLPAIIASCKALQDKWANGYTGTNLHDQVIVQQKAGEIISPYEMLPKFTGVEMHRGDEALEYYAEVILGNPSESRKDEIRQAALAYCEMDTLAEVIVLQGLMELSKGENF